MMKVSELEDAGLDYWVAKAINADAYYYDGRAYMDTGAPFEVLNGELIEVAESGQACVPSEFDFSEDWSRTGPLIEKYGIELQRVNHDCWLANVWPVDGNDGNSGNYLIGGPTPLIAACLCIVASIYGEEVPDE